MSELKIERSCQRCGAVFSVIPSRLKHGRGQYCSPACQYAAQRARPKRRQNFVCIGCGADFERFPSWTGRKGGGKFCTRDCRDLHWRGDKNPNWIDGEKVHKRGSNWRALRRSILARDGYRCVGCDSAHDLHVHHVIPFRLFEFDEAANHPDNLVTLCASCHRREESRFKWAAIPNGGGVMRLAAGGAAWTLARERGML